MKKTVFTFLLFLATITIKASDHYVVFLVKGNVTAFVNGKIQTLNGNEILDESVTINVNKGAYLTLKSSVKKRITLTASHSFHGTIKQLKRLPDAKQKHSRKFMLTIEGKTASDFVDSSHHVMSKGGYTHRNLFEEDSFDEENRVYEELHSLLLKAGLIDR